MSAMGPPFSFSITWAAFGPLDLEAVHCVRVTAAPIGRDGERSSRTSSTFQSPVSTMELDPVHGRHTADELVLVLLVVEQDAVADHAASVVRCNGHELLGHVQREILEGVDPEVGDQLERVRTLDVEVRHVVGLVEQHLAVFCHAVTCSAFQLENSVGTTG